MSEYNQNEKPRETKNKVKQVIAAIALTGAIAGAAAGISVGVSKGAEALSEKIENDIENAYGHSGSVHRHIHDGDTLSEVVEEMLQSGKIENPDNLDAGVIQYIVEHDPQNSYMFIDGNPDKLMAGQLFFPAIVRKAVK